ncbi:MAG: hypothetical protein GY714_25910 [Desulfobacterales bacterium]|nr:hypothetical protein [Desulfobacterales bacterium]
MLESVLLETENKRIDGVVTGVLAGFNEELAPLVSHNYSSSKTEARSLVTLKKEDIDREVALMFENGNPEIPIIMGLMQKSLDTNIEVIADGKKQEIKAEKEILLKCGKASILLRDDGKIVIKGTNIISRAKESNKIRGGSVKIN